MKKTIIIFAVGLLTQQITQAQGTTYLSNLGQASAGGEAAASDSWLAAEFFTGNNAAVYTLNSIELAMTDATGNPSDFTVSIYTSRAGGPYPDKSLGALTGSLSPTTAGAYTFTLPFNHKFLPSDDYFIVLTSGTVAADGAYEWSLAGVNSYNPSGGWRAGKFFGSFYTSSDGLSWNQDTSILPQFAIIATAIPEPSALGLLGLGGLGFLWHRRKTRAV